MAADKTSVNITYLDSKGKKGTKAITDINPNADNGSLKNFCSGLNALTNNTLTGVEKIERTDITSATAKPKLALTLSTIANSLKYTSSNEDGRLFNEVNLPAFTYKLATSKLLGNPLYLSVVIDFFPYADNIQFAIKGDTTLTEAEYGQIIATIFFEETATTAATTAQITIHATDMPELTIL